MELSAETINNCLSKQAYLKFKEMEFKDKFEENVFLLSQMEKNVKLKFMVVESQSLMKALIEEIRNH